MDAATPHIPAPSSAWSRLAPSNPGDLAPEAPLGSTPHSALHGEGNVNHLRARLLRMIVDSEHTRKAAAAEAFNHR